MASSIDRRLYEIQVDSSLGSVIRREEIVQQDNPYAGTEWESFGNFVDKHIHVYFKPANGAHIQSMELLSPDDGYSDPRPMPIASPIMESDDEELIGSILVTDEIIQTNGGEPYETSTTTTCRININGYPDKLKLKIFGHQEFASQCRWFTLSNSGADKTTTYIVSNASEERTITNVVLFDDDYILKPQNGQTNLLPPHFAQARVSVLKYLAGTSGVMNLVWRSTDKSKWGENTDNDEIYKTWHLQDDAYTSRNHKMAITMRGDVQIDTVLLYVDSFLQVARAGKGWFNEKNGKFKDTSYMLGYTNSAENAGQLTTLKIPLATLSALAVESPRNHERDEVDDIIDQYTRTKLYCSKAHRDACKSANPPVTDGYISDAEAAKNIPIEHRWVELLPMCENEEEEISRWCNIVNFVDINADENTIRYIDAECDFARVTGYWVAKSYDESIIIKQIYGIPNGRSHCKNQLCYPIFKPWAEVDLWIFSDDEVICPDDMKFLEGILERNYTKNDGTFPKSYRKKVFMKFQWEKSRNDALLDLYTKLISPFRNEFFLTHGARTEYDQEEYERMSEEQKEESLMGNFGICYAQNFDLEKMDITNFSLTQQKFLELNKKCQWWNPGMKVGLYLQCCFGGGIQQGLQRNILKNGVCHDAKNILPMVDDIWYHTMTTATHYAFGGNARSKNGQTTYLLRKLHQSDGTYAGIMEKMNNSIQKCREKSYAIIKRFFNKNFNLLLSCIRSSERQMWKDTRGMISDDLDDLGRKYMASAWWMDENAGHSDSFMYVDGGKKYLINNTAIGALKNLLLECDCRYAPDESGAMAQEFTYAISVGVKYIDDILNRKSIAVADDIKDTRNKIYGIWKREQNLPDPMTYMDENWKEVVQDPARLVARSVITEPIFGCCGKFLTNKNARFLVNPDPVEDNWLTSDKDLELLALGVTTA